MHWPGVMTPGQLGPTSCVPVSLSRALTRTMSSTGMCSVMQITRRTPASAASHTASAATLAGTKTTLTSAPVSRTALATVLNTGTPRTVCPPLPGVQPATTVVP